MMHRVFDLFTIFFCFRTDQWFTILLCVLAPIFFFGYSKFNISKRGKFLFWLASSFIVLCIGLTSGIYLWKLPRGLSGIYYKNSTWTGNPTNSMKYFDTEGRRVDHVIDFHPKDLTTHYPFPGKPFSIKWEGYLYTPYKNYQPGIVSNFGAWLHVDDVLVDGSSTIDFGVPEARTYLREGWSYDEQWGQDSELTFIWSSGRRTEFYLGIDDLADYYLIVRCIPFSYNSSPEQELTVHVNGVFLNTIPLKNDWNTYTIKVPGSVIQDKVPGFFRIRFTYSNVVRPAEVLNQSQDQRELAVAFDFAMLQKVDTALASSYQSSGVQHVILKAQSDGNEPSIQLVWKQKDINRVKVIPEDYLFPKTLNSDTIRQALLRDRILLKISIFYKIFLSIFLGSLIVIYIGFREIRETTIMLANSQKFRSTLRISATGFGLIISFLVILRLWYLLDIHAVNILYRDQWDFYSAFFHERNLNLWELFHWQHGPHRQGIGFLFTKVVAMLSGWNSRTEVFTIGGIVCLAMFLSLWLKTRLVRSLSWSDAAIPLMFLTPAQYEIFFNTPNLSHGSVPLLLLVLYCFAWTLSHRIFRYIAVLLLNFFLIYTGFGIFTGIITPVLLFIEYFHASRNRKPRDLLVPLAAFILSLLSIGSFFIDYTFDPTVGNFQFPYPQYWQYPRFIALAFANFCGVKGVGIIPSIVGFAVFLAVLVTGFYHTKLLFKKDYVTKNPDGKNISLVVVILTTFSLLFCTNIAVGRIALGLQAAQFSRYVPYLIPAFFGLYLHLTTLSPGKTRNLLMIGVVIGLIAATFPLRPADAQAMIWFSDGKTRWKNVYLQTENIEKTDQITQFDVYPWPEATNLKEKLEYLKAKKLNLYLDTTEVPIF